MEESEREKIELKSENEISVPEKKENFWVETIRFVALAILIVFPIRYFIAQPFIVSGSSMDPTFIDGEYLIVDQVSYRFEEPRRGDVIIFKYPLDPRKYYIKRVIGLPGETLTMKGEKLTITKTDGKKIDWPEPYVKNTIPQNFTSTLTDSEYFVMGDNRPASSDSRIWGPLDRKFIIGRPAVRLLPVTKLGVFPGEAHVAN